ncbi:hypothetical protein [Pedobacter borealis]|uniref:hypothetical protein n=1 Tax=Pedobacter borealis TaxID=475254 RepID=UPI00049302F1|nr:hypothetical protein [Pedobacter borealis]
MNFSDSEELRSILWPRVEKPLLKGYFGGVFNKEHNKFYAATLTKISEIDYDDFEYHHDLFHGYTSLFYDFKQAKNFITPDSWQSKSTRELIDEKVYTYFSVSFTGMFFEAEWFILKSLTFYGNQKDEIEVRDDIQKPCNNANFWHDCLFLPNAPLQHDVLGKTVTLRDIQFEEFKDSPYLVAILKQEKKEKINRAFANYCDEEFIKPFFEEIRITFPSEYTELCPLRINYPMIFPVHKKQVIFCALVADYQNKWRLRYYLLNMEDRQFYEWVYFKNDEHDFSFFYSDLIINNLKTISNWDEDDFLDSSCTMDDDFFWKEYVFRKENNSFLFLKLL